jgi:nucleosome binding factor SPN SPT16 subunit
MIYIDNKNNTILLPFKGSHVPFHILILKSVVKNDEGKFASLRFNFHLPSAASNLAFPKFNETTVFIKELVFRSQQTNRLA